MQVPNSTMDPIAQRWRKDRVFNIIFAIAAFIMILVCFYKGFILFYIQLYLLPWFIVFLPYNIIYQFDAGCFPRAKPPGTIKCAMVFNFVNVSFSSVCLTFTSI